MNSIVLTTATSKTQESHKLSLKLTSPMTLNENIICLSHCNMYYNWKNFKSGYKNTRLSYRHIPTDSSYDIIIPDGSYSVKDINNFIHFVMYNNNHIITSNAYDINLYANVVYNRITASVGKDYELRFHAGLLQTLGFDSDQMPVTNKDMNGNKVPQIERVETVLVHCNLVHNQYEQDSSLIFSFVPNAPFGSLLDIRPSFPQWRETRIARDIRHIEISFTDQDYRPLDLEDKILVELQIKKSK